MRASAPSTSDEPIQIQEGYSDVRQSQDGNERTLQTRQTLQTLQILQLLQIPCGSETRTRKADSAPKIGSKHNPHASGNVRPHPPIDAQCLYVWSLVRRTAWQISRSASMQLHSL